MTSLFPPPTPSRRAVVRSAAVAVFGAALPLASRPSTDRYAPYRGQTVAFSLPHHPHFDAMLKLLSQFTRDTGIKVEVARESILRMKPLQMAELAQAHSNLDLVSYVVTWKSEYVHKNLLAPLDKFLANADLGRPRLCAGGHRAQLPAKHRHGGWAQRLFAGAGCTSLRLALWGGDLGAGLPARCVCAARFSSPRARTKNCKPCCSHCATRRAWARSPRAGKPATTVCTPGCCT